LALGITIPFDQSLAEHATILRQLGDAGYSDIWTAETARADAFAPLMLAAAWSPRARLGTAIASVFSRGPGLLAMNVAALADAAPGRVLIGLGASSRVMSENWNDRSYDQPTQRVQDTLTFLRAALAGEQVNQQFDTFSVSGFRLERFPDQLPGLLVAALRQRMLTLAGSCGDGVILNWISAADVAHALRYVHEGADKKTRAPEIVARIFVCPSENSHAVRAAARQLIARYLTIPVYAEYQRWLGHATDLQELWDRWWGSERSRAADSIPDDFVDSLVLHGSPEACIEQVEEYLNAGVTIPVLKVLPLDAHLDPFNAAVDLAHASRAIHPDHVEGVLQPARALRVPEGHPLSAPKSDQEDCLHA
jgi:probable F420-dependent oxidoreductase